MKPLTLTLVAALSVLTVLPAYAADVCNVSKAKWQSEDALKTKLAGEGWTVRQIKQDQGCYEVYAVKTGGDRMESLFNPETLDLLDAPAD